MSSVYNYLYDLQEQREKLIDQVAELDMNGPIEIGSDAAAQMAAAMDAIDDLNDAIKQIGGEV